MRTNKIGPEQIQKDLRSELVQDFSEIAGHRLGNEFTDNISEAIRKSFERFVLSLDDTQLEAAWFSVGRLLSKARFVDLEELKIWVGTLALARKKVERKARISARDLRLYLGLRKIDERTIRQFWYINSMALNDHNLLVSVFEPEPKSKDKAPRSRGTRTVQDWDSVEGFV